MLIAELNANAARGLYQENTFLKNQMEANQNSRKQILGKFQEMNTNWRDEIDLIEKGHLGAQGDEIKRLEAKIGEMTHEMNEKS